MKDATLRQLQIFESVARNVSFSRAAAELHLTQPAVSMQVRALEQLAGLPLTEQVGRKVRLTAAGAEVAAQARRVAQILRETGEALAAMKGLDTGLLAVGVTSTAKYFAPSLLAEFRRCHPGVDLRLSVSNRESIVRQLGDNAVDLAIMGTPPREFATVSAPFADHPLAFIAAAGHPLAARRKVDPAALAAETLLIREPGSGTRTALEKFLAESRTSPKRTLEMSSNETIKQAVMAGMGVAFLSEHTIALERATGRIVELKVAGTPVMRRWHLVHRADKRLLPVPAAFDAFVREEGAARIAGYLGNHGPGPKRTKGRG